MWLLEIEKWFLIILKMLLLEHFILRKILFRIVNFKEYSSMQNRTAYYSYFSESETELFVFDEVDFLQTLKKNNVSGASLKINGVIPTLSA
mgnify:FL=1